MASYVSAVYYKVQEICDTYGDARIGHLPLMGSPWPTFGMVATFLFFIKYLGPKLMKNRKAFNLKKTMIFYNLVQIVISICALEEAYIAGFFTNYSWTCEPISKEVTPANRRLVAGVWLWYISKFVEFLDTIFFVLRKKDNQVSKLHVYHHSIMPFNSWLTAKFVPGGQALLGGVINSFVHLVMYTYYLLAALGPNMRKYLWWKQYLTVLQMGQFVLIFLHMMQVLFIDCGFPRAYAYFTLSQATIFLILFTNFYTTAYREKPQKPTAAPLPEDTVVSHNNTLHGNSNIRKRPAQKY